MTSRTNVVGFDFGTTNSLISVVRGGRVLNLLDEDERPIPSVVCYEGAQKIRGRDAKRRLSETGRGVYGNIVRSPKMYLGGDGVIVDGVERSPVEMVRDVVDHVVEQSRISANARWARTRPSDYRGRHDTGGYGWSQARGSARRFQDGGRTHSAVRT